MKRNDNKADDKSHSKGPKKIKIKSEKHSEDFNTGSHSPAALLNVEAGYDDTGKGNASRSPGDNKDVNAGKAGKKGNSKNIEG